MKVVLVDRLPRNLYPNHYSIEAGYADGKQHFDHHGKWHNNPAPCRDVRIPKVPDDAIIFITHMDADTFAGLQRMFGKVPPKINLEELDLANRCGDYVSRSDEVRSYIVGISALARKAQFPKTRKFNQDVTNKIVTMLEADDSVIMDLGRRDMAWSEVTYRNCISRFYGEKLKSGRTAKKGLWIIGENDPMNPARPFGDAYDIVVIFRKHFMTISIYCNPRSDYAFAGKVLAGIKFTGHPQTCGSRRGEFITEEHAIKVFNAIDLGESNDTSICANRK